MFGVTKDEQRFHKIVRELEPEILPQIAEVVELPLATGKYKILENLMIGTSALTEEMEIRELLTGLELANQKPSQLLRAMKRKSMVGNLLHTLGFQRWPTASCKSKCFRDYWFSTRPSQLSQRKMINDPRISDLS